MDHDPDAGEADVAFADSDSDLGSVSGDEVSDPEDFDEDGDYSEDEDGNLRWKQDLSKQALAMHGKR
ncbi:hypothetical protein, partial [uncultured Caballeronia sp.]|uniref:hypothetical protein n=1 Tax=uncultured Caballeronia sp. TaxID=1827198 RepID=UPI0035CAE314